MNADPPYLFADLYEGDAEAPSWTLLATTPQFVGAIVKCTEGLHYAPDWFINAWRGIRNAAPVRYGSTWMRGAYHYLHFTGDGQVQADTYLAHVERAGGWGAGDIVPIVDVERGPANGANAHAGATEVIDTTSAWAARVREVTGRRVMLYGRGLLRDLGIRDRMGCDLVWCPAYTADLVRHGVEQWTLDETPLWQYAGDGQGDASRHHLPLRGPLPGDLSVFVDGARKPTIERLRAMLL
jgi:GH25 family lysozyme M1 (1,4-beta-N-acetylmuramidase)